MLSHAMSTSSSDALQTYVRGLKTALEAKDPRAAGAEPASILLSFPGDGLVTVDIQASTVRVLEGDQRDRESPSLLVRTHLHTWMRLCTGEVLLAEVDADLLGDPRLLSSLARLWELKRSSVSARIFH